MLGVLSAQVVVEPEAGRQTNDAYPDKDGDGWDDDWVAKYPEAKRDSVSDANGDGMPNFIEMMLDVDPFAKPRGPNRVDPLAAQRAAARRKVSYERNRQALAPYMNYGLRDSDGNLTTRAKLREAKRQKLSELSIQIERERPAKEERVKAFLQGKGKDLPESVKKGVRDVVDGEPRNVTPLGHREATFNGIYEISPTNPDTYSVTWESEVGGVYEIDLSPDLGAWKAIDGEFLGSLATTSVSLDMEGFGGRQFIRVRRID